VNGVRKDGKPRLSDQELKERLARIRGINRAFDQGEISWADRIRLHNQLVPGIGDLETHEPRKGR
jgi:hypothetical protein